MIDRPDLVLLILDYIKTLYSAIYTGYISVTQDGSVYIFKIGIPSYMVPTSIIADVNSDQEFLDYLYEELRTRNYMKIDKYKVERTATIREE